MSSSGPVTNNARTVISEEKSFYTNLNVVNLTYFWSITNFQYGTMEFKSPVFFAEALDTVKWHLSVSRKNSDSLTVTLHLDSAQSIVMKCSLSVLQILSNTSIERREPGFKHNAEFFLPNGDVLPIKCNIEMLKDTVSYEKLNKFEMKRIESSVLADLSKLYESQKFSDVTLNVNGTHLRAHKAILASRSKVFAAMFEHDLEEKATNRIDITDFEEEVMVELLRFIYSGKSPNLDRITDDLLEAADMYALEDLKELCVSLLAQSINSYTAVQTLILADRHHEYELKCLAMDWINANATTILSTDYWQKLKEEYPLLCIEIYEWQKTSKG